MAIISRSMLRLATIVALTLAAPASAAWTPPQAVGPTDVHAVTLAFTGDGTGRLAFSRSAIEQYDRLGVIGREGLQAVRPFDAWASFRSGSAMVSRSLREVRDQFVIRMRLKRPGERWRVFAGTDALHGPLVVTGPDDRLAVVWSHYAPRRGNENAFLLRALVGRKRGRLRRVTLARVLGGVGNAVTDVAATYDSRGVLVVAYERAERRGYGLWMREGSRPPRRLGTSAGNSHITLAAGAGRRLAVLWSSEDGGEERNRPRVYRAAVRTAGGFAVRRLDVAHQLSLDYPETLAAAFDGAGAATFVWSGEAATDDPDVVAFPVRAITADPDGNFGEVETLAASGAVDGAVGTAGGVTTAWRTMTSGESGLFYRGPVQAATRPTAAAAFAPAEEVSRGKTAFSATLAADPRTGTVWAVYLARDRAYLSRLSG